MTPVRIAANDSTLAHAVASRAVAERVDRHASLREAAHSMTTPRQADRVIRRLYGPMLIGKTVWRPHGSRAAVDWHVVDFSGDGDHLRLARIEFRGGGSFISLQLKTPGAEISTHALARTMQRRTNRACAVSAAGALLPHLIAAARLTYNDVAAGESVTTTSRSEAVLWTASEEWFADGGASSSGLLLRGWTVIAPPNIADPTIERMLAETPQGCVRVRCAARAPFNVTLVDLQDRAAA